MTVTNTIRRVAVIGAGPSGLASAKYVLPTHPVDVNGFGLTSTRYLLAERYFDQIDVFEQRSSVGGVWNYSPRSSKSGFPSTVLHSGAHDPAEKPIWISQADGKQEAVFLSPLYDRLETNIPKELMRFSDKPFPSETQLFPKHHTVKKYLEEYARDVKSLIHFETQVADVRLKESEVVTWELKTINLHTGHTSIRTYDAVVVASGHYTVPHIPDIPGIETWNRFNAGAISHSKFYDSSAPFTGKKVVVVGNSASGLDIGAQINEVSKGKVIISQRSESYFAPSVPSDKIICPEIAEFLDHAHHDRAIRFANGHVEEQVDAVVFCTGYFYSYPFLESLNPSVVTHGWRTMNVYQQLFYNEHPTLVFPVLSQRVIPFPMAENQAAVFARVWSGRLRLPSKADMHAWEDAEVATKGDGKAFHILSFPLDADYLNFLYDWAASAESRTGLADHGMGKLGTYWGERERWMRAHFPDIRGAFVRQGSKRGGITTLAELGFNFEEWREQQKGKL